MSGMQDLNTRLRTGLLLSFIFVAFVLLTRIGDFFHLLFVDFVVLVGLLAAAEYARFSHDVQRRWLTVARIGLSMAPLLILNWFIFGRTFEAAPMRGALVVALLGVCTILTVAAVLLIGIRGQLPELQRLWAESFVAVYLFGFGAVSLEFITALPSGPLLLLWLLLVVVANDSVAYFIGRKIGGPPLVPVVSPGKTVSGAVAGVLGGALVGFVFSGLLNGRLSAFGALLAALVLAVAAIVGDCMKSYLKRVSSVKDSGTLLPGHGGVLDRIDGYLGAAPLFLILYVLLEQ